MGSPACEHVDFEANIQVIRLTDGDGGPVTGFTAEIRLKCVGCGEPFIFLGPGGFSPTTPMVSADGLELRAPCTPQSAGGSFLDQVDEAMGRGPGEA